MARIPQNAAARGSQHWVQKLANDANSQVLFLKALKRNRPDLQSINWLSPITADQYSEYSDKDFLRVLNLSSLETALGEFWPQGGPNWDGLALAKIRDREVPILVEVKSKTSECYSNCEATNPASILMIENALNETKGVLKADSASDWLNRYYQFSNRLAHAMFIRENNKHRGLMVFINIVNDTTSPEFSTSLDEWRSELSQRQKRLTYRHNLLNRLGVFEVFWDVKNGKFITRDEAFLVVCGETYLERKIRELSMEVQAKFELLNSITTNHYYPFFHERRAAGISNCLVMPFISKILNCDIMHPCEVIGDHEGIDYQIMVNGSPYISVIIAHDQDFDMVWRHYLSFGYKYEPYPIIGKYLIITDGIEYSFYTIPLNINKTNGHLKPSFTLSLNNIDKRAVEKLQRIAADLSQAKSENIVADPIEGMLERLEDELGIPQPSMERILEILREHYGEFNFIPGVPGECKNRLVVWALPPHRNDGDHISSYVRRMCSHLEACEITNEVDFFTYDWPNWVIPEFRQCFESAKERGVVFRIFLLRDGKFSILNI